MLSQEKIAHEKEILINEINTGNGNYALFVLKTFKFIKDLCKKNNSNWCLESKTAGYILKHYIYSSVNGGKPDHMGAHIAENAKKTLLNLGYIERREVNGEIRIYILKDIEFCDYEDYIYRNSTNNKVEIVYNYLKRNGVYIFKYEKNCFNCHKKISIYSYYLGNQTKNEIGIKFEMQDFNISNLQLFETIGIGKIEKIDKYLMNRIPTIHKNFSKTMNMEYVSNTCEYCGAMQGMNYVVYYPFEIKDIPYKDLKKKVFEKVNIDEIELTEKDIKKYL